MTLRRVNPGDAVRIPAAAYNAWCAAADDLEARQRAGGAAAVARRPGPAVVRIRNDSGAARARHDVLGVAGVVFEPSANLAEFLAAPVLRGATPDADDHAGRFVVLLEPVAAGKIGLALAAGVIPVTIDMKAAGDRAADVADGQAGYLESAASGAARILWAEAGTGQRRAVVVLGGGAGGESLRFGKLKAELAHDDSVGVAADEHTIDGNGAWQDTTEDIEGVLPPIWLTEGSLPSGAGVVIGQSDGKPCVVAIAPGSDGSDLPAGVTQNDMLVWDGAEWVILPAPATSGYHFLTVYNGSIAWRTGTTFVCPEGS